MNFKKIREQFTLEQLLSFARSKKWQFHDQDILNVLSQDCTLLLDARWNVLPDYGKHNLLPQYLYQQWEESLSDPWVIHYGGELKPWKFLESPALNIFGCMLGKLLFIMKYADENLKSCETNQNIEKDFYFSFSSLLVVNFENFLAL